MRVEVRAQFWFLTQASNAIQVPHPILFSVCVVGGGGGSLGGPCCFIGGTGKCDFSPLCIYFTILCVCVCVCVCVEGTRNLWARAPSPQSLPPVAKVVFLLQVLYC